MTRTGFLMLKRIGARAWRVLVMAGLAECISLMNTPTAAGLAGEVRAEMARQGLTVATVAQGADISPASLSRRLNGSSEFTVAEMFRVAGFLGMTLSDLLRRAESAGA